MHTNKHKQEDSKITKFILHIFSCIAGGLFGTTITLITLVAVMYTNSIENLSSNDFSGGSLLIIVFVLSFTANISAVYFSYLSNKIKYQHKKYILQGVFYLNIFIFIAALPFYLLASSQQFLLTITGIHLFLSASGSALLAEIFAGVKYAIGGVIGVNISQMLLIFIYIGIGAPSSNTMVTVLFTPFIWMVLPVVIFGTQELYNTLKIHIFK